MGWKQCTTPFLSDLGIQEEFDTLFFALGAPEGMALFCRTPDNFKNNIFLLTPDAAKYSDGLPPWRLQSNRLCGSWLPMSGDQPCTDGSPASTHLPVEQRKPRIYAASS
jgi:hypothetical protein